MNETKKTENKQTEINPVRTLYSLPHPLGARLRVPIDDDGANSQYALVEGSVWQELIELGLNPRLRLHNDVVEVWCGKPRRWYQLKCFIANVSTEDKVSCLDKDELNLIRSNLLITSKPKPEMYREYLDTAYGMTATLIQYKFGPEWGATSNVV